LSSSTISSEVRARHQHQILFGTTRIDRQPYDLPSHEMRIVTTIMMMMDAMIFRSTNIWCNQHHDISTFKTFDSRNEGDNGDDNNDDKYDHDDGDCD
jgi:hypothetical protein